MLFQVFIAGVKRIGNFIDGIKHRGMVFVQFLADVRGGEVGQLPDQINGNLAGFSGSLILQRTTQHGLIHRIEFANLVDDQTGRGQGRAIAGFVHIPDNLGNVTQNQGHAV